MVVVSFFGVGVTDFFFLRRTQELERGVVRDKGLWGIGRDVRMLGGRNRLERKLSYFEDLLKDTWKQRG